MKIRVGFGFDVHQLEAGRDFWLGGIKLESIKGAVGHSDADVLIHAICDALLGAANLRDIGFHFQNTDERWKGKDSKFFLKEVTKMLGDKGWKIENVDCTIALEKPKINPHIQNMKSSLAPLMNISEEDVSIKATTNEKLGYVGREDGVNAYAVALISKTNVENIQLIQTDDGSSSLLNVALNETYHSTHGAIQESTHVFIKNGLQYFIKKNNLSSLSVFEVGFGTGLNALLTLLFAAENKIHIDYTSLEAFPIEWEVASQLNYSARLWRNHENDYFKKLHRSTWGDAVKITENFSLLKEKTTLQTFNIRREQFDIIFFDAFAPSKQPEMWELPIFEKIVSGMKSEGIFVTYCAKGQVKRDLKLLGMNVESLPGPPGKREMVRATKP